MDKYAESFMKGIEDDELDVPYKIMKGEFFYIYANYSNGIGFSKSWLCLPRSTSIEYDEDRIDYENPSMVSNLCSISEKTSNLFFS